MAACATTLGSTAQSADCPRQPCGDDRHHGGSNYAARRRGSGQQACGRCRCCLRGIGLASRRQERRGRATTFFGPAGFFFGPAGFTVAAGPADHAAVSRRIVSCAGQVWKGTAGAQAARQALTVPRKSEALRAQPRRAGMRQTDGYTGRIT